MANPRTLPPPSLAETDLSRFLARAIGRSTPAELGQVREALGGGAWPKAAAAAFEALVERLGAEDGDLAELDPDRIDRILESPEGLRALEARIALVRSVLRPGTLVTSEVSDRLRGRIATLPGVGSHLGLVGPVLVVELPGVAWSSVRGPALARLMDPDEAEAIRDAWATIEERWRWPDPSARPWEARFVHLAARPNLDLDRAVLALEPLEGAARVALFSALLEHLRDQSLPEAHRPGARGLEARLREARVPLPPEDAMPACLALAEEAYAAAAPATGVARVEAGDLARWLAWVEVPDASRERIGALPPAEVEHYLRRLEAVDAGRLPSELDPALERDLRAFRDGYLRHRYGRRDDALFGIDPLHLARAQIDAGEGRAAVVGGLRALAEEARAAAPVLTEEAATSGREAPTARPLAPPPAPAKLPPIEPPRLPPLPPAPPVDPLRVRVRARTRPGGELPPLPPAPIPRQSASFPRTERPRTRPITRPVERGLVPAPGPGRAGGGAEARAGHGAHLVTPAQATRFYESAFRELEVLERDLLERGPWAEAVKRVEALTDESAELARALGPPARSGDHDFGAALRKVGVVQAYLERIRAILNGDVAAPPPAVEPPPAGVFGRVRRLLGKDE